MSTRTPKPLEVEFAEHGPFLRALARRLATDYAAAEDLVQETFVAALGSNPTSQPSSEPGSPRHNTKGLLPWFATVLRNRAALRRRTDHRRKAREQMVTPAAARPTIPRDVRSGCRRCARSADWNQPVLAFRSPFRRCAAPSVFGSGLLLWGPWQRP